MREILSILMMTTIAILFGVVLYTGATTCNIPNPHLYHSCKCRQYQPPQPIQSSLDVRNPNFNITITIATSIGNIKITNVRSQKTGEMNVIIGKLEYKNYRDFIIETNKNKISKLTMVGDNLNIIENIKPNPNFMEMDLNDPISIITHVFVSKDFDAYWGR